MKQLALLSAVALLSASSAQALITQFDLIGTAGLGLLPGNEPGSVTGGTGGEIGAGIFFDDGGTPGDGGLLTISNVGWGSSQGFTNLSSNSTVAHIHGPTMNNFGFSGTNFVQTTGVFVGLTRSSAANTGGTFTNAPIAMTATDEANLFNGKFYINIHTSTNTGGELRGFMIPVPEPSTAALAGAGIVGLLSRRRRRS